MNKTGLVIQREYLSRVKKKSFLVTTILVPVLIAAFYALIISIGMSDDASTSGPQQIAVLDEGGILPDSLIKKTKSLQFTRLPLSINKNFEKTYADSGFNAFLKIPKLNIDDPKGVVVYSTSSMSMNASNQIEDILDKAVENKRLEAMGIDAQQYNKVKANVSVGNVVGSQDDSKATRAEVAYLVSMVCGMMIYLMMIIYGTQVMRGVTEEKINRISEVIVSSVKPFELMVGKVVGIGLVGLTQFAIWMAIGFLVSAVLPMFMPHVDTAAVTAAMNEPESQSVMKEMMAGIAALPLAKIIGFFAFYFLFGYLTYAAMFAAIGSVVSDDQNEAQQLVFPIMMPIILGFVIMMKAINQPDSALAIFGSLFPLTSPVVMMGRITFDIPFWQIAASMILLIAGFIFFTWLAGKIYRTGILMYGKKAGWKEMIKWAFAKT